MRPDVAPDPAWSASTPAACGWPSACTARSGSRLPLGTLDVSFYRDDYGKIGLHRESSRSEIPFAVDGRDDRAGRRRALHRPHDPRGAERALRLRPAARACAWRRWSTAAAASCRSPRSSSAPTRAGRARRGASSCSATTSGRLQPRAVQQPAGRGMNPRTRSSTPNGELHHLLTLEGLPRRDHLPASSTPPTRSSA